MNRAMVFDDETIQKLFGFEDAESESIERLKEYYLIKKQRSNLFIYLYNITFVEIKQELT